MVMGLAWCWPNRGVRGCAHEVELSVAPAVLAAVPLRGRLVTGDALYCHRALCQQIRAAGGDYLVVVKRNQPRLHADVALLFTAPPPGEVFATATQRDRHGDRHEVRHFWASTALRGYLDWPGAHQVCKVERVTTRAGIVTRQVRYFITSLDPSVTPATLLCHVRGHWGIENRLHYVRDVTLGEDASQVRSGAAPQVMAAPRNTILALLRHAGWTNIAAAIRHIAWQPGAALLLLGIIPAITK